MAQHDKYETDILKALQSIARSLESIDKTLKKDTTINDEKDTVGQYLVFVDPRRSRVDMYDHIAKYYCGLSIDCQIDAINQCMLLNNYQGKVQSIIYIRATYIDDVRGFKPKAYFFANEYNFDYVMRSAITKHFGEDKETESLDELLSLAYLNKIKGEV